MSDILLMPRRLGPWLITAGKKGKKIITKGSCPLCPSLITSFCWFQRFLLSLARNQGYQGKITLVKPGDRGGGALQVRRDPKTSKNGPAIVKGIIFAKLLMLAVVNSWCRSRYLSRKLLCLEYTWLSLFFSLLRALCWNLAESFYLCVLLLRKEALDARKSTRMLNIYKHPKRFICFCLIK